MPKGKRGGKGGDRRKSKYSRSPLQAPLPQTLSKAIGSKGRALSIGEAVRGANPFFDETGKYRDYNWNCQRCVIAYEARRRGYDVTAQPTYSTDKLPKTAYGDNAYWMGAFRHAKSVDVGGRTQADTQSKVEAQMRKWGNGARAVIRVRWYNGGGHVFNVENQGGKIVYVDAQIGKVQQPKDFYPDIVLHSTRLVRTDNLRFSERAKKSVWTVKR